MPDKDSTSGPPGSPVSTTVADGSDPLSGVGHFVLELIRKAAERKATPEAPLRERIKTLEAQLGRYKEAEHQAALCGTLLTEMQRNLLERTEEAKVSGRKFVDAAALLRAANKEVSHLKATLQDKERELSELKRNSVQMMSYMRALIAMIEASRSPAQEPANATAPSANLH
jgi:DNA repair exonuclease SbcCD ATPase subunit